MGEEDGVSEMGAWCFIFSRRRVGNSGRVFAVSAIAMTLRIRRERI